MIKSRFILFLLMVFLTAFFTSCISGKSEDTTPAPTGDTGPSGDTSVLPEEPAGGEAVPPEFIFMANNFVDAMVKEDFTKATENFDAFMTEDFKPEVLKNMWTEVIKNVGDFKYKMGERAIEENQYFNIYVNCEFEKGFVDARVSINPDEKKIVGVGFAPSRSLEENKELISIADKVVDLMVNKDFKGITEYFDDTMKAGVLPEKLEENWEDIIKSDHAGPFKKRINERIEQIVNEGKTYDVVYVKCEFEKTDMEIHVAFDENRKISRLFFNQLQAQELTAELEKKAFELIDSLVAEDYTGVTKDFNDELKASLTQDKLSSGWEEIIGQMGPCKRILGSRPEIIQGYNVLSVGCEFEKAVIEIQIAFDNDKKVAGITFIPPEGN